MVAQHIEPSFLTHQFKIWPNSSKYRLNPSGVSFCVLIILVFLADFAASDFDVCHFEHYNASCTIVLSGVRTLSTATINHCHDPVDVTFNIKAANPHVNWRHTFITTNPPENQEVRGFMETILLHVELHIIHNQVIVKAAFHVNNFQDVPFLDSQVNIDTFDDCLRALPSNAGKHVTLGVALVALLLGWCAAVIGWVCRRKRQSAERLALVDDMEVDILSSTCPSSSRSSSTTIRVSELKEEESFISSTSAAG